MNEHFNALKDHISSLKQTNPNKTKYLLDQLSDLSRDIKSLDKTNDITPYEVSSDDLTKQYEIFREKWGLKPINDDVIKKLESIIKKPVHHWFRREIFYCHIDFDKFLDAYLNGKKCYIYTGRGPSSESMHLGHLIPFKIAKYLQDVLDIPVIIQLSDDEKVYAKGITHEGAYENSLKNIKDIIALGFNLDKTWIFSNMMTVGKEYYVNISKIMSLTNLNTVKHIFGFDNSVNIGLYSWFAFQEAPVFSSSFPDILDENSYCLVPMAIDQYPFFRHVRDIADHKILKGMKPAIIASKFFPSLTGLGNKMDSSGKNPAIFLTDNDKMIKKNIQSAFSGGRESLEDQIKLGAVLEVDVSYQWLTYFLEDDQELEDIKRRYGPHTEKYYDKNWIDGRLMSGHVKNRLIKIICDLVLDHQQKLKLIDDDLMRKFMSRRKLF
jgi:tryptophanyl-tRNA synthetase